MTEPRGSVLKKIIKKKALQYSEGIFINILSGYVVLLGVWLAQVLGFQIPFNASGLVLPWTIALSAVSIVLIITMGAFAFKVGRNDGLHQVLQETIDCLIAQNEILRKKLEGGRQ